MKLEHKVTKELVDRMIEIHFPFSGNQYEVTVMEMLDVMPIEIKKDNIGYMLVLWGNGCVQYYPDNFNSFHIPLADFRGTFGNALAEMILWLHENKYITFNNEK